MQTKKSAERLLGNRGILGIAGKCGRPNPHGGSHETPPFVIHKGIPKLTLHHDLAKGAILRKALKSLQLVFMVSMPDSPPVISLHDSYYFISRPPPLLNLAQRS